MVALHHRWFTNDILYISLPFKNSRHLTAISLGVYGKNSPKNGYTKSCSLPINLCLLRGLVSELGVGWLFANVTLPPNVTFFAEFGEKLLRFFKFLDNSNCYNSIIIIIIQQLNANYKIKPTEDPEKF